MSKLSVAASIQLTDQQAQWANASVVPIPSNTLITEGYQPETVVPSDPENWLAQLLTALAMQLQTAGAPLYNSNTVVISESGNDYCYVPGALVSVISSNSVSIYITTANIPKGTDSTTAITNGWLTSLTSSVAPSPIGFLGYPLSSLTFLNFQGTGVTVFGGSPGANIYALLNGQTIPKVSFPTFFNVMSASLPSGFSIASGGTGIIVPNWYNNTYVNKALVNAGTPAAGVSGTLTGGSVGQFTLEAQNVDLTGAQVVINGGTLSLYSNGLSGGGAPSVRTDTGGLLSFSVQGNATIPSQTVNPGAANNPAGVKAFLGICIGRIGE